MCTFNLSLTGVETSIVKAEGTIFPAVPGAYDAQQRLATLSERERQVLPGLMLVTQTRPLHGISV